MHTRPRARRMRLNRNGIVRRSGYLVFLGDFDRRGISIQKHDRDLFVRRIGLCSATRETVSIAR